MTQQIKTTLAPGAAWPAFEFRPQFHFVQLDKRPVREFPPMRVTKAAQIRDHLQEYPNSTALSIATALDLPVAAVRRALYNMSKRTSKNKTAGGQVREILPHSLKEKSYGL